MIRASVAFGLCFALSVAAHSRGLTSRPDLIAHWTKALRDAQPDDPYAIVYHSRGLHLIFAAVQHENAVNSPTFRLIDQSFRLWPVRSVIVEGTPSALGSNPPELVAIASRSRPDPALDPDGETGPAVRNALKIGAQLYGGEPSDLAVRDLVRRAGVADLDLIGYYVLRVIPQWTRDGSIARPDDPRLEQLVHKQLRRSRAELGLPADLMPDFRSFADWYQRTNGKLLSAGVDQEESGPLADGPWPTNRIGAAVSRARDAHLVAQIADRLNKDRSVLVVFGGSHALIDKPALHAMLGRPCYVGPDMTIAAKRCLPDSRARRQIRGMSTKLPRSGNH